MLFNMFPDEKILKAVIKVNNVEFVNLPITKNNTICMFTLIANLFYCDVILEVTLDKVSYNRDLEVWIDSYTESGDIRNMIGRIYGIVFENSGRTIEDTQEEKEIKETLKLMYECPVCKESPVSICECEERNSICKNGHEWYYDYKNNKILLGHK